MTTQPRAGLIPEFTFADRCRKARELTGMSKEDFADRIGVTRHTVSNYEAGRTTRPQRLVLSQWAMATGVDRDWLLTGETKNPPSGGGQKGDPKVLPRLDSNQQPASWAPLLHLRYAA